MLRLPSVSTYALCASARSVLTVRPHQTLWYAIRCTCACALYEHVTHTNTSLYSTVAHQIAHNPQLIVRIVLYTEHYTHGSEQWTMYGRMDRLTHLLSVCTYLRAFVWRQTSKRFGAEEAHWAHNPRVGGSKLPIASRTLCFILSNTRKGNFANYYIHKRIKYRLFDI